MRKKRKTQGPVLYGGDTAEECFLLSHSVRHDRYLYFIRVIFLLPVKEPSGCAYVQVIHLCLCQQFEFWLNSSSTSVSSKDQIDMEAADMDDVEDVEEEETGEGESKGWCLHSVSHR